MTFMDAIMFAMFVFSGLVVIVNVIFKRMEAFGRKSLARRIDYFTVWIYPVTVSALVIMCRFWFVVGKTPVSVIR
jgi:hypothetical protein